MQIIAGKNKGTRGKVLSVSLKDDRVLVEGVNKVKKAIKKQGATPGYFVEAERSIHVSNVSIIDPSTDKPAKVGFTVEDGKKRRISKKSGKTI